MSLETFGQQLSELTKRQKLLLLTALGRKLVLLLYITKFYRHIHADLLYICTGDDVTNYFLSEATAKKSSRNAALDGFRWNFSRKVYGRITKFHTLVGDNWPHKSAGGYGIALLPVGLQNVI